MLAPQSSYMEIITAKQFNVQNKYIYAFMCLTQMCYINIQQWACMMSKLQYQSVI